MSDRRAAYEAMSRDQLIARLKVAEDVCVLFGWSVPQVREGVDLECNEAVHQMWSIWHDMAGDGFTDPGNNAEGSLAAALSPHNPDHATAEELAGAKAEVSMLKECLAVERRRVDLTLGIPQAPCANCGHRPIDHGLLGLGGPCIQPGCDCRYLLKETA